MSTRAPTSLAPSTPRLGERIGRAGATAAYAAGGGAVLAMLLARAMVDGRLVYPGCGFRWLTGRPCPGCGGTHALAALAQGEVAVALAHHPLMALAAMSAVALAAAMLLDRRLNRGRLSARVACALHVETRRFGWWVAGAIVVNWAYLLCASR